MKDKCFLGIDMGGTQIRAALVTNDGYDKIHSGRIDATASIEQVLQELFTQVDKTISTAATGIGIGVPGIVDEQQGIVYDVTNIPGWTEVPLKKILEDRYQCPVLVNNDSNCFALGEYYFGKGRGSSNMLGVTIGTGLGTGIIMNGVLQSGNNGGAGEFGMCDYLDKYFEYYASGQFFQNVYGENGEVVFSKAQAGDTAAIKKYEELGKHLGNAIKNMLYALDPQLIVLGGSVSKAFLFFSQSMWTQLQTFAYKKTIEKLKIEVSELENSGILGAAALHLDHSS